MARDPVATREAILAAAEKMVLRQGFGGASVDAVIGEAGVTKGAFFHHFKTKADMGHALVQRYADADIAHLEQNMARAERMTGDPVRQILIFIGLFAEELDAAESYLPGCLFASYLHEAGLFDGHTGEVVHEAFVRWREILGGKFAEAIAQRGKPLDASPEDLADMMTVIFEGGLILSKSFRDKHRLVAQLRHYGRYVEFLFGEVV